MGNEIFSKLKEENYLIDIDKSDIYSKLSYYLGEINALHPFREGNGRVQRIMIEYLAQAAGYELDFSLISETEMIEASIDSFNCEYDKRRLFIMKQAISSIKENIFLKIYLISFSVINFAYVFFEVSKARYIKENSLGSTIAEHNFKYLESISNISSYLEMLILAVFAIYLLVAFIKKDKLHIKDFILINFSFFAILFLVNYIVSLGFSAYSGNATQQLIIPFIGTFLVMIYFIIATLYKRTNKIQSN